MMASEQSFVTCGAVPACLQRATLLSCAAAVEDSSCWPQLRHAPASISCSCGWLVAPVLTLQSRAEQCRAKQSWAVRLHLHALALA